MYCCIVATLCTHNSHAMRFVLHYVAMQSTPSRANTLHTRHVDYQVLPVQGQHSKRFSRQLTCMQSHPVHKAADKGSTALRKTPASAAVSQEALLGPIEVGEQGWWCGVEV